jgi:hypothetical protein
MSVSFLNSSVKNLPRGLRNNNLGNLRISNIKWQGKIPNNQNTDKAFEQFTSLHFGLRAMLTDVANDITIKKLNTLTKLVNSYAPPTENDTVNYINFVSRATGLQPNEPIKLNPDTLAKIVRAKILIENGTAIINKLIPDLDTLIKQALADLNEATKKRINWKKAGAGAGLLLAAFIAFFFIVKK